MKKRLRMPTWAKSFERNFIAFSKMTAKTGRRALRQALKPVVAKHIRSHTAVSILKCDA